MGGAPFVWGECMWTTPSFLPSCRGTRPNDCCKVQLRLTDGLYRHRTCRQSGTARATNVLAELDTGRGIVPSCQARSCPASSTMSWVDCWLARGLQRFCRAPSSLIASASPMKIVAMHIYLTGRISHHRSAKRRRTSSQRPPRPAAPRPLPPRGPRTPRPRRPRRPSRSSRPWVLPSRGSRRRPSRRTRRAWSLRPSRGSRQTSRRRPDPRRGRRGRRRLGPPPNRRGSPRDDRRIDPRGRHRHGRRGDPPSVPR